MKIEKIIDENQGGMVQRGETGQFKII